MNTKLPSVFLQPEIQISHFKQKHQNFYHQEQFLLLMQPTEQVKTFLLTCDSHSCQHLYRAKLRDRSRTCWSANGCSGESGFFYVLACKILMLPVTAWLPRLLVSRTLTSIWGATIQFLLHTRCVRMDIPIPSAEAVSQISSKHSSLSLQAKDCYRSSDTSIETKRYHPSPSSL